MRFELPAGLRFALMVGLAWVLTACGGGGSSAPPAPPTTYTVGGTVSGLVRPFTLALSNNATDALAVNANGSFVFSQRLAAGAAGRASVVM